MAQARSSHKRNDVIHEDSLAFISGSNQSISGLTTASLYVFPENSEPGEGRHVRKHTGGKSSSPPVRQKPYDQTNVKVVLSFAMRTPASDNSSR